MSNNSPNIPPPNTPGRPPSYMTIEPQSSDDEPEDATASATDPLTGEPCLPPPRFSTISAAPPAWSPARPSRPAVTGQPLPLWSPPRLGGPAMEPNQPFPTPPTPIFPGGVYRPMAREGSRNAGGPPTYYSTEHGGFRPVPPHSSITDAVEATASAASEASETPDEKEEDAETRAKIRKHRRAKKAAKDVLDKLTLSKKKDDEDEERRRALRASISGPINLAPR